MLILLDFLFSSVRLLENNQILTSGVFNADVQMDGSGNVIPLEQKKFILEVVNVPTGKPND